MVSVVIERAPASGKAAAKRCLYSGIERSTCSAASPLVSAISTGLTIGPAACSSIVSTRPSQNCAK
jgi:hypothetical protein